VRATAESHEEVAAVVTTKEHLNGPAGAQPDLDDRDIVAVEETWTVAPGPPAATDASPAAVARKPLGARLMAPIPAQPAAIAAATWVVLLAVGIAVEPQPVNPDAVDPWFVSALGILLMGALVTAFAGFFQRRRWSLAASLAAAGLLVVSTLMCPASGHHAIGAWWVVQLGCGLGLVAASTLGLRLTAPR
jgi:hypothetical protein